jgi:hypothetical protein
MLGFDFGRLPEGLSKSGFAHTVIGALGAIGSAVQLNRLRRFTNATADAARACSKANPITVSTLSGDQYTVEDWGTCKDLRVAVARAAPELDDPATFALHAQADGVLIYLKIYTADRDRMLAGEVLALTLTFTAVTEPALDGVSADSISV